MPELPLKEPSADHRLKGVSCLPVLLLGLGLTAGCGAADWFSGPEIAFSVLYLAPISLVAYKCGRWLGLAQAFVCGLIWLGVEVITNTSYSSALIPYWNGTVRFLIFATVALLVAEVVERKRGEKALRLAHEQSEERAQKLTASEASLAQQRILLQSILDSMGEGVVVVDAEGRIMLTNPAADAILHATGYGKNDSRHPLQEVLMERRQESREISLSRRDATAGEMWLLVSRRPLHRADERFEGGVIVFSDITALRKLERQIAEVSDREQRRLGQDLHDGLCQQLVSMAFAARTLADRLRDDARPETAEADRLAELLNDSITQARDVARGLYLVQLEVGGLASALEELANRIRGRHQLKITFEDRTMVAINDAFVATDLFRIAQEAVSNTIKHARATEIKLSLEADESLVTLRVQDNGIGIPSVARPANQGMGLHIMQYRARMIGASCTIEAGATGGTVLTCSLVRHNTGNQLVDGQPD
ncbi:MAG: ATP-binding protein [Verrucomicrobiota bacterium]